MKWKSKLIEIYESFTNWKSNRR